MPLGPQHPARRHRPLWRRLLIAIFLILLYWRCTIPANESPFVHYTPAAYARNTFTIIEPREHDQPAEKATRKYNTFAHRVLDIDAEESPVSPAGYALLDAIIEEVKARIVYDAAIKDPQIQRTHAKAILRTIDDVLTQHNVLYPPGDYDVTSLRAGLTPQHFDRKELDHILRLHLNVRRREHALAHANDAFYILDCDISSFVYVGVAEVLGIELHLVDLPNHMFVRWPLSDGTHLNWDPNVAQSIPDETYQTDYSLAEQIRTNRIYLASMTRREAEGFVYFLRAMRFEDRYQDAKAIADLEKARELYPHSTQVAAELGWLYATVPGVNSQQRKQAIALAQSAVHFEPGSGDFWDSLAAAHAANGDFKLATKEARQAESLARNPQDRADYRNRRQAFEKGAMPD